MTHVEYRRWIVATICALVCVLTLFAIQVSAEESTSTTSDAQRARAIELRDKRMDAVQEKKEMREADRAAMKEEMKEKRDALSERRDEQRGKLREAAARRIESFFARMYKRFEAAVERLDQLAIRIGSRIEKLKERGIDTSKSESLLATGKTRIQEAKDILLDVKGTDTAITESDTPKDVFMNVRDELKRAKEALKEAHAALVQSIRALKASAGINKTDDESDDDSDDDTTTTATSTNS